MVDGKYEIRESKVISGTQFIIELLGVNADQFRQLLFCLKVNSNAFLISNSREKQGILRTLFDSEKFEAIREILKEEVKKKKLKSRIDINKLTFYGKKLNHLMMTK
ncbi:hypothetical protein W893_09075 [Staphylococcus aureus subsp. aureus ST 1413]|nr:hypothetical protein W893_09075 [Staphylococcus aureus subsp. aureus ST 1413]